MAKKSKKTKKTRTIVKIMAQDWKWHELQMDIARLDEAVSAAKEVLDIAAGHEAWDNVADLVQFVVGDIASVNANLLMEEVIVHD